MSQSTTPAPVIDPADVDYLYYVKCGNQGHSAFTASYAEFLHLKATCL